MTTLSLSKVELTIIKFDCLKVLEFLFGARNYFVNDYVGDDAGDDNEGLLI